MSGTPVTTRIELEAAIQARAVEDSAFRAALLANPAAALEAAFGIAAQPGVTIRVIEETPGEVALVLPAGAGELSGKDLEGVSGGYAMSTPVNAQVTDSVTQANVKHPGDSSGAMGWPSLHTGWFPFRRT
ncbi:NHLP leader peptide domain [Pannonibacter phragmitetus]|uniref:NHLP leader peptide domain n=1 Tax=Pannonibacter phragmitetus TaxID=121719 RepID=A0A378ZUH9_9HYPH|nr:NHLP leader peptide family RiPP precursor [Pannonibacter phragmitetus]SUB00855.1 NHLP leader peptide domain [Pannonibacter phragmitetus]